MKYIVEFEDEPCMYEDEVHFYKCIQAPWWGLSERVIKQLTPYQPDAPDTNVGNITNLCAHENDPISRHIMGQPPEPHYPSWYAAQIEKLPAAQPDHNADISEINKFIDGLEEILADIRERHVDDSVCGLCEYDGAYMGQSGDWCNECPGFDKDDCFKLSDETRKKWIEEIVNTYPDHTADIGKKVSISCGRENDLISRQAAIDALDAACVKYDISPHYDDKRSDKEKFFDWWDMYKVLSMKILNNLPSTQHTLCGYNIEHLILIANVLRKENLPPERVVEALMDIGRIVSIVKDEFEESLRKAVEQCKV